MTTLQGLRKASSAAAVALVAGASWLSAGSAAFARQPTGEELAAARGVDGMMIVDCLLPGQVRQLGARLTYLSPRRPAKLPASECGLRGGEYVAYDRADLRTALAVWLPEAENGEKQAQTYVGEIFERGMGDLPPDYAAAATWYRKAADQGYSRALINLGFLYEKGLGVSRDPVAALNLYRKASGVDGLIALDEGAAERQARSQEEVAALRRDLEQARRQLDQSRQELQRRQDAQRSDQQRLEQQKQQAAAAGNTEAVRRLESELSNREQQLAQQRQDVRRLEQLADTYRAQLAETQTQSASMRDELERARSALAAASSELDARRAQAGEDQQRLEALRDDLARARRQSAASEAERKRIAAIEQQLRSREEELARSRAEIARLEQDAARSKEQLARLETQRTAAPPKSKDAVVAVAPPSIQLIDPPVVTTRSPLALKVRGDVKTREIVGKVTAPAGLLSFTVNDRSESVDANGLFRSTVALTTNATPVSLVAVDAHGKRAALEFTLVPQGGADGQLKARKPVVPNLEFGSYHALVIGNQQYKHLPTLDTAIEDARSVADVLARKYGFKVTLLTNATRYEILSALNKLRADLTEKDNLLIYYAGHGELDRANLRGHWLPIDAERESDANWISSVSVTDILNAMSVKHVLVVADSCYSGAMTRSSIGRLEPGMSDEARQAWLKALAQARARTVLTSGGLQPVMDGGGGKHSVFAKAFLEVLRENEGPLEAQRLYREVAARVVLLASRFKVEQRPEYAPLKFAGHQAGDFIFVPAGT